jgi:hypothetical protein
MYNVSILQDITTGNAMINVKSSLRKHFEVGGKGTQTLT